MRDGRLLAGASSLGRLGQGRGRAGIRVRLLAPLDAHQQARFRRGGVGEVRPRLKRWRGSPQGLHSASREFRHASFQTPHRHGPGRSAVRSLGCTAARHRIPPTLLSRQRPCARDAIRVLTVLRSTTCITSVADPLSKVALANAPIVGNQNPSAGASWPGRVITLGNGDRIPTRRRRANAVIFPGVSDNGLFITARHKNWRSIWIIRPVVVLIDLACRPPRMAIRRCENSLRRARRRHRGRSRNRGPP